MVLIQGLTLLRVIAKDVNYVLEGLGSWFPDGGYIIMCHVLTTDVCLYIVQRLGDVMPLPHRSVSQSSSRRRVYASLEEPP